MNKNELLSTLMELVKQLSVNELKELIGIVKKRYAVDAN